MHSEQPAVEEASLIRGPYRWLRRQASLSAQAIAMLPRVGVGMINARLARSDNARWRGAANLEQWWETRTIKLAAFVADGARVIEFGAGRCRLATHLGSRCVYFASDLVPRIPGTIVCDLNQRPFPELGHLQLDVAFFAGVLEYIADVPALAGWLTTQVHTCVVSYDGVDSPRWSARRVGELGRRKYYGYMSDYEPAEIVDVFEQAGFRCARTDRWESQELYLFVRVTTPPSTGKASVSASAPGDGR